MVRTRDKHLQEDPLQSLSLSIEFAPEGSKQKINYLRLPVLTADPRAKQLTSSSPSRSSDLPSMYEHVPKARPWVAYYLTASSRKSVKRGGGCLNGERAGEVCRFGIGRDKNQLRHKFYSSLPSGTAWPLWTQSLHQWAAWPTKVTITNKTRRSSITDRMNSAVNYSPLNWSLN